MSMSDDTQNDQGSSRVLKDLWRNWAVSYGAITLPILFGLFVPRLWLPFICLVEAWALIAFGRTVSMSTNACSLVLRVVSRTLMLSAIVMFGIAILCTDWLVPTVMHLQLYNSEIPFVTCLVISPATVIMCLVWLYGGFADNFCRNCQRRNGYYAGDSIVATLYYRETRYQITILMILSLVVGAVEYWYYFARYINSDLSNPDRFFFNYIPLAMYLLSLFFIGGRYTSMRVLYQAIEKQHDGHRNRTVVRFLIFCGDEMLLMMEDEGQWDTPVEMTVSRISSMGSLQAGLLFSEKTGKKVPPMRYCFTNKGFATGSNMIHYAVFVSPEEKDEYTGSGVWFNTYMLDSALAGNMLAPTLANELYRIHTMTMAWKTYDRNGRRLYPIRHYRPTFRLRDLPQWNVDYDDQTWFDVAHNNEDHRFFRLRSVWNRLTDVFNRKAQTGQ